MKRWALVLVLLVLFAGCAQCILMRSEYYDMTGKVFTPKSPETDIPIYEVGKAPERPYTEIGAVKVIGQPNTSRQELEEELKKRARLAGADALIEAQYREDTANKNWFCGRFASTKRNAAASAKAVLFLDSK
ncbi:MAG: hypothetical protein WC732_02635 [Candidatus Omnitrophota bacterium]